MLWFKYVITIYYFISLIADGKKIDYGHFSVDVINASNIEYEKFKHFWSSTGFCPPDPKENIPNILLGRDEEIHLALIGSLPNKGIKYIRIHWLLNLLTSARQDNILSYNFTQLDIFLDYLHKNGLYPGVELMGYPISGVVEFMKTERFWTKFVESLVRRYIRKFGARIVSKWRFETWNEPDLKGYNVMNFTVLEFLGYVNGCAQGLKNAFRETTLSWNLGGPAGLFRDKGHPLCWSLLETCAVSAGDQCPVQFISFHRKGGGSAQGVLNGTFSLLDEILDKFPELKELPFANDEADIEQNWSKSLEWRGDVRYAVMVVRVIAGYHKSVLVQRKLKIEVLSNDNAFLNYHPFYFTQRTLFARFQINTTTPCHSQFIKKPVYSLMALLSFLGDEMLEEKPTHPDPLLTTIATRSKHRKQSFVSVVLAYGNESYNEDIPEESAYVNIIVNDLWEGDWMLLVYKLDNIDTNPYNVWKTMRKPIFPSVEERRRMREVEELQRLFGPKPLADFNSNITLKLNNPSIHLIHVCSKPETLPNKPYAVSVNNITWNEVVITWKYKNKYSKCLLTHEVEFRSKCSSTRHFKRINPLDTIFTSFHHVGRENESCEWTRGEYRVRVVDYWFRHGKYSGIILYS